MLNQNFSYTQSLHIPLSIPQSSDLRHFSFSQSPRAHNGRLKRYRTTAHRHVRPIRRIITAHDPKGKAYFASDELLHPYDPTTAPCFEAPGPHSGFGVIQIHRSRGFPVNNMRPIKDPHRTLVPLADTKGPSCRIIDLPPAEAGWMHRTLSLNYVVVLSGTVGFRTDGGEEKVLKEHDVIVVRGVNHEWINRGNTLARLFAVVVPSKEIVTEDGLRRHRLGRSMIPQRRRIDRVGVI